MAITDTPELTSARKFGMIVDDVLRYNYTTPLEVRRKLEELVADCERRGQDVSYETLDRLLRIRLSRISRPRVLRRQPVGKVAVPTLIRREWLTTAA